MADKSCRYGCGATIKFDDAKKSKLGKFIPLNQDGSFHVCPNKPGTNTPASPDILEELKRITALLERISGQLSQKP